MVRSLPAIISTAFFEGFTLDLSSLLCDSELISNKSLECLPVIKFFLNLRFFDSYKSVNYSRDVSLGNQSGHHLLQVAPYGQTILAEI